MRETAEIAKMYGPREMKMLITYAATDVLDKNYSPI